jgi:hypothetical protein
MTPDLFSAAGIAAVALVAGVLGMRMMRDEGSLRRKRILAEKY